MPVIISKSAQKDIVKLDEKIRNRIFKAIDKLEQGIIKPDRLQGCDKGYKVKVGKYRILWKYKDGNIEIAKVKLRKIVYRNL
ncbi:MAG TPA: type II toxin-antitoxin system RelE/ParE family toxin [Candidatus Eremiobacteraeota bacterium]|nr:MAG: Plasmid stabilization system protein [bacterium ADurb.Bin363]HPZ07493.1 type II toxin-antitoxin system RelE/ParE family toxin [Candidatus Eremiobacteraeota bacterium]